MLRLLTLFFAFLCFQASGKILAEKNYLLPHTSLFEHQREDTTNTQKPDSVLVIYDEIEIRKEKPEKEKKKKKPKRRLVWTGWKTGFHWSTPKKR